MTYFAAFVASAAVAVLVIGLTWVVSRGRLLRADRVGAAAIAVGFVAGYGNVGPRGLSLEQPVTWLPLLAVAGALILPRLFSAAAPNVRVPWVARIIVVVAAAIAAMALYATGNTAAAGLALAVLGALLGSAIGEILTEGLAPGDATPVMGGGVSATVGAGSAAPGAAPNEPATTPAVGVPLEKGVDAQVTASGPPDTSAELGVPGESVAKPPPPPPTTPMPEPTWARQPVVRRADNARPGTWVLGAFLVGMIPVLAG